MWEIELERMSEGVYGVKDKPAVRNRWDESVRILLAAKKQLLSS
jgi:hypothetical protein